jgi:hypothetical protein
MSLAHRSEVMDAHIADNNWKKTINMGMLTPNSFHNAPIQSTIQAFTLCNRWKRICGSKSEHLEDFEMMDQSVSAENRSKWIKMADDADGLRLGDVSAMDIYNVKLPNG